MKKRRKPEIEDDFDIEWEFELARRRKPVKPKERPVPRPPERKLPLVLRKARPPKGFFSLLCGQDRVQIVCSLTKDWSELLCYHHRLHCTLHLHRSALYPKKKVDKSIEFLKSLDEYAPE